MARDFRNKTFQKVLRGYAQDEVDDYIAYLNEEYKKMERRAAESERKLALAQKKLDDAMKNDGAVDSVGPAAREAAAKLLRDAEVRGSEMMAASEVQARERAGEIVREAEERAAETMRTAVRDAEGILTEAKAEAEAHKNDAQRIYDTAQSLFGEIGAFREKLFNLYNEHLDAVDGITEAAQEFMDGIDGTYPEGAAAVKEAEDTGEIEEIEPPESAEEEPAEAEETDTAEEAEFAESVAENDEYEDEVDDEVYEDVIEAAEDAEDEPMSEEIAENLTFMDRLFASQFRPEENADEAEEEGDLYIDVPEDDFEEPVITIDWKNRSAVEYTESGEEEPGTVDESADFRAADGFEDMEALPYEEEAEENYDDYGNEYIEDYEDVSEDNGFDEEDADEEEDEYSDMDAIFNEDPEKRDMSLTDEFNIIFAEDKSRDNVQEISRQPTVTPEAPKKGKKHKGF